MGKFYTANQEFENYLVELGFKYHTRSEVAEGEIQDEEIKYYTESNSGKQVKVNLKSNLVTLLNEFGNVEDESSSFTDNQINNFLNK